MFYFYVVSSACIMYIVHSPTFLLRSFSCHVEWANLYKFSKGYCILSSLHISDCQDLVPYMDRGPSEQKQAGFPPPKRPRESSYVSVETPKGNFKV